MSLRPMKLATVVMSMSLLAGQSIYNFAMKTIDGRLEFPSGYQGKLVLIVNVASKCGFTPQYSGLQTLFARSKDEEFVIIGFPANSFANQKSGTDAEIRSFCPTKYNVTFPIFSKVSVGGRRDAAL
jgi:glutathione peroxidase-family protein